MRVKQCLELLLSAKDWPNLFVHCILMFVQSMSYCLYSTPLRRRRLDGAISRVPATLHDLMWAVMQRCSGGIVIAGQTLPQVARLQTLAHANA